MDIEKILKVNPICKRVIAISDIHGNLDMFQNLLEKCKYRVGEDALVLVGDIVEKGSKNIETLHFVMELAKQENLFALGGNCDNSYSFKPEKLVGMLGRWGERSLYFKMAENANIPLPKLPEDVPQFMGTVEKEYSSEMNFLKSLPMILEMPKFLFAHAGLENEDLEAQAAKFVVSAAMFPEVVDHVFSRLLVVGHQPCKNYRTDIFDSSPHYDERHNVLSIDGGNIVITTGQLNAVILDPKSGEWQSEFVDAFPEITSPVDSAASRSFTMIVWPENQIEVLREGKEFSLCRKVSSGAIFSVPNDIINKEKNECDDTTDAILEVEKGEKIRLVHAYSDRWLIKKGSVLGWILL